MIIKFLDFGRLGHTIFIWIHGYQSTLMTDRYDSEYEQ